MSSDSNLVSPNQQELGRQADDRAEVGLHEDLVVDVLVEAGDDVGVGGERRQRHRLEVFVPVGASASVVKEETLHVFGTGAQPPRHLQATRDEFK